MVPHPHHQEQPSDNATGDNFRPVALDLVLSGVLAFGFPLVAGWLLELTGALLPMVLYYALAWGIAKWRRGCSGYHLRHARRPPVSFWVHLAVMVMVLVLAWLARMVIPKPSLPEVLFTAVVWAVANASSEQLLWIYLFDSWDLYGAKRFGRAGRVSMRLCGIAWFTVFVGLIHMLYWAKFLHTVEAGTLAGVLFVIATTVSGFLHIVVWRQGSNMLYTFIPHFMLNLIPLLWTGYSILPYLLGSIF